MTSNDGLYRIVVGVDGSPGSRAAMKWCATVASRLGACVTAVSVIDPPQHLVPLPQSMTADLEAIQRAERDRLKEVLDEQWCKPLREAHVRYEAVVHTGTPAPALVELTERLEADLLVVGRRRYGRLREAMVGSVPHNLAHHAKQPLVIVPEPSAAS